MGIQFYWFYDVLLAAILIGIVYVCARAGFTRIIAGLIGVIIAFSVATWLSMPVAEFVYDRFIQPGVKENINYTKPESAELATTEGSAEAAFNTLRRADMSKAVISGRTISEMKKDIVFDDLGKVTVDLTDVDLKDTGIADGDLGFFGIDSNFALETVVIGKMDISAADYAKYSLEDIILAKIISHRIAERAVSSYEQLSKILEDTMPSFTRAVGSGMDTVTLLVINIITNNNDTLESAVNDNIVRPAVLAPLRVLIFAVIFILVCFLVSLAFKATHLIINIAPLLGKIDHFLGGVVGILQAAIVILLVCIVIRLIITLTGDDIILLNTMTIDKTYLFKRIYYLNFIRF